MLYQGTLCHTLPPLPLIISPSLTPYPPLPLMTPFLNPHLITPSLTPPLLLTMVYYDPHPCVL